jgi:predicted dehydrogenase
MAGKSETNSSKTRREFLKTSAAAGAALAATNLGLLANVHAAGSDTIKVGLIGCGGRGSGAADNVLHAAPNVRITALGDVFKDKAEFCRGQLKDLVASDDSVKQLANGVDVPDDRIFGGFDAYRGVIENCDYVMLATPPGFRPMHIEAAIAAGKNLFTEKPVATTGPGIRRVLAAYEEANRKKLCVVAGTQRRHQAAYIETIKRVHEGAIGTITSGRCYWNQGALWVHPRKKEWNDMEYQLRNWYHFTWLCGDHIVEQHVHNLDVINWATGKHPLRAVGMGGRQVRTGPQYGQIFDHFAIDYEYPDGVHVLSMSRQIPGCEDDISEAVSGTKGHCIMKRGYFITGENKWETRDRGTNPYVQEHTDLIEAIRTGKHINELKNVAESTLTAIMGRMSAYTGKAITWKQALESVEENVIWPSRLDFNMTLVEPPVAVPGRTKLASNVTT